VKLTTPGNARVGQKFRNAIIRQKNQGRPAYDQNHA